mgnify:CR=1 FL=1
MSWALMAMCLIHAVELPAGPAPEPVTFPHFPDRLHAFVWFNWQLVPAKRMAEVLDTDAGKVRELGMRMGLPAPPEITEDQWRRSYITILRRNWHLLPYPQLLELLDWTAEEMAFTLREDDFLFIKLGNLKPACAALHYKEPDAETRARAEEIGALMGRAFPDGLEMAEPLFSFVEALAKPPEDRGTAPKPDNQFDPRFCSSYFMLYGDPFLEPEMNPYPDGYLQRLRDAGVNGVWLQAVLYKMTPFPWDPARSEGWETRLENLRTLTRRTRAQGVGVYLYLNEPRSMPESFFEEHPDLRGVKEGAYSAMCTSVPEVRDYLRDAVARVCEAAPDLAGFFTISASENLTNCWSHHHGENCPRCKDRPPAEVIAGVNRCIQEGIERAGNGQRLIAWDWGWRDEWAAGIIARLPEKVALQSVSEWSIPIERGGVKTAVGEYSVSVVGPGPRATRHWALARERGLDILAKVQANNTWELSTVPYIPVVANTARHALNLREAAVDGLMLGWTLGGHPAPNLEVYAAVGRGSDAPLEEVAEDGFGAELAAAAIRAWRGYSEAIAAYPYHGGVLYRGPQQMGPANPLWPEPTGYRSTMVCFPYDDLNGWSAVYPPDVFAQQFAKVARGFEDTLETVREEAARVEAPATGKAALEQECAIAEACAIHFRSVANQAQFVMARDALAKAEDAEAAQPLLEKLARLLEAESRLAKRLFALQNADPRLGFEASNHYFYVPLDLAAKVVNCDYLLSTWLPAQQARLKAQ